MFDTQFKYLFDILFCWLIGLKNPTNNAILFGFVKRMNDSRIARESIRISCLSTQYWHDYMRCKIKETHGDIKFHGKTSEQEEKKKKKKCGCCDIQWGIVIVWLYRVLVRREHRKNPNWIMPYINEPFVRLL